MDTRDMLDILKQRLDDKLTPIEHRMDILDALQQFYSKEDYCVVKWIATIRGLVKAYEG